jgi:threonylcarbamoyladenosine tRNA methylthiotransferase MtaB
MKVFIRTYGCRANQYDSEALRAMLRNAGIEETMDPALADAAVFNSCTVTSAAEADLRADIRAAARLNPSLRSVVMGCASGVESRDEVRSPLGSLPGVTALVPGADLSAVAAELGIAATGKTTVESLAAVQTGARALLRIQDGCDEHCTFCATTLARGSNRSRSMTGIVDEAATLALSHPEIVITGIHIGSYGTDIGSSLGELVETLIAEVPVVRFRLSSLEATEVDARLRRLFAADSSRLAPHLHAPLQSGSDRVLRKMGRSWYDAASYADSVRRITENASVFALSGDVISGFPGESDADHAATMRLVEDLPFTALHVFPYSARPGTAALRLPAQVQGSVARARAAELRRLADAKGAAYRELRNGRDADVVVTRRGEGLTEDYLSVTIADTSIPRRSRFRGTLRLEHGKLTVSPAVNQPA